MGSKLTVLNMCFFNGSVLIVDSEFNLRMMTDEQAVGEYTPLEDIAIVKPLLSKEPLIVEFSGR